MALCFKTYCTICFKSACALLSMPFYPLFAVLIRECFHGLFCKPYSSRIPIDNNQEELNLVTEVANPLLLHFCSFFLSTVVEKSHLKYNVVLHQNEHFHHAEIIFLRNYLEKYLAWLKLFDLQVVSHTFKRSDFLQKKKTALLNSHLLFRIHYLFFVDVVCKFLASNSDSYCTRNKNFNY